MKAAVLDGDTLGFKEDEWKGLSSLCELHFYPYTPASEIITRTSEMDAIFTNKVKLSEELLVSLPRLKYIGVLATGVDAVAIQTAKKKGICVSNVPEYGTYAVAQHVFSMLLSLTNQVTPHDMSVKAGKWSSSLHFSYWMSELSELAGKTLGLVGYGRIAKAVMGIAKALGMDVIVYTPRAGTEEGVRFVSLETLFKESDVISLHCPLTVETRDLINKKRLASMKSKAILINTGRGGLIDEEALANALKKKEIQAACLDVLKEEPPFKKNPLLSLKNCIITPHIAWAAKESRKRLFCSVIDNFSAFLNGQPKNVV